jgi:Cofilin/tropomyosin-type actin-binding protein
VSPSNLFVVGSPFRGIILKRSLRSITQSIRAPETAKTKAKMVYAGSKDALTRSLVGVSTKISATDLSELTVDILVEACRKFA